MRSLPHDYHGVEKCVMIIGVTYLPYGLMVLHWATVNIGYPQPITANMVGCQKNRGGGRFSNSDFCHVRGDISSPNGVGGRGDWHLIHNKLSECLKKAKNVFKWGGRGRVNSEHRHFVLYVGNND